MFPQFYEAPSNPPVNSRVLQPYRRAGSRDAHTSGMSSPKCFFHRWGFLPVVTPVMSEKPLIPLLGVARDESELTLGFNVVQALSAESEIFIA